MISAAHERALALLHDRLGDELPWAIGGSIALALQGVDVSCNDLDVLTSGAAAAEVERLLAAETIEIVAPRTRGKLRGMLGRVRLEGLEVEILGDVENLRADGSWTPPPRLDEDAVRVARGARTIPVMNLVSLRESYAVLNRPEKVELIDRAT